MFRVEHFSEELFLKNPLKILKLLAVIVVFVVLIYRAVTVSKVAELDKVSDLVFNNG